MDPDKSVTNDLIARGFGRDIMGMLLAYREQEVVDRLQTLHVGDRKVTIMQAQQLLDAIVLRGGVDECCTCHRVDIADGHEYPPQLHTCCWCKRVYCLGCMPDRVCTACKHDWCSECGCTGCTIAGDCVRCAQDICDGNILCSQCWLVSYAKDRDNPPYDYHHLDDDQKIHTDTVAARLGYMPEMYKPVI